MNKDYEKCIDCGKCTEHCLFLKKYNINLKEYAKSPHLAYNCYLCGKCKSVCPVDIDGRKISLNLRKDKIKAGYNLYKEGYGILLLEKRNYVFKNYKDVNSKIAFFPGCNFPAYYPETTKMISYRLKEKFDISTIFDCCGKPVAELSMEDAKAEILSRINTRLADLDVSELIVVCPNCYYYFKELGVNVSMIYEHSEIMKELIQKDSVKIDGFVFSPCPDRESKKIYSMLNKYVNKDDIKEIDDIQCCGAGGCASVKERKLTKELQDEFKNYDEKIYLYCATCCGMIAKSNKNIEHILSVLMGTDEKISTGAKTIKNRIMFSVKK